jgi:metallophosphoesterase superfamily enzyme
VLVAGNHDRRAFTAGELHGKFETERFCFHHGDGIGPSDGERGGRIEVIGHYHPAATLQDGAGFVLKLPAFVQTDGRWILPAFSPWAAGGAWPPGNHTRTWLCSPKRILPPRS